MKKYNQILTLCLIFSFIANLSSYAMVIVPPHPQSAYVQSGTGVPPYSGQSQNQYQTQNTVKMPEVQAEGAILLDAVTGKVIFEKNAGTRFYPASITKLMTALLVLEKCKLEDVVTFSNTAVTNLESGSVSIRLTAGDKLTVKDCLYALMLKSANEVANGLAEHVAGSVSKFADMMNARAKALGCANTNFANPSGLNNSNHYTTPYDMALIAREAFKNQELCRITSTLSYQIPATKLEKARKVTMGHKMLYPSDERYYPGIIGGKTGYTSLAGNTLVTCVEKDGVRLIAVIMKSKQTHYADTKTLLDFGFNHVEALGLKNGMMGSIPRWSKQNDIWYFYKSDGFKAQNQWLNIDGADYWFDQEGRMAVGWKQFSDGTWYYFKSSGAMAQNSWVKSGEKWFYLGDKGTLVTNSTTPDGYRVDSSGAWVS